MRLPELLDDIAGIVSPTCQTDPTFKTTRLYRPLTAGNVREQLISKCGYTDCDLPCERTIRTKMNDLEFYPRRVAKSKPLKKLPQTNAIFEEVHAVNEEADITPGMLRISLDTKAVVKIGPFSRGGKNRQHESACDHDFSPEATLTPLGIHVPATKENYLSFCTSKATADCIVDCLEHHWPTLRKRHGSLHTLVINADNGPECSGRRTRWLERLAEFATRERITVMLAYYPPYHSKYNPIERVWGVLEKHWRGELLTSIQKTLGLARTMTYSGKTPRSVRLVRKVYRSGVRFVQTTARELEERLIRKSGLESYFITIQPEPIG
jgi:transposase